MAYLKRLIAVFGLLAVIFTFTYQTSSEATSNDLRQAFSSTSRAADTYPTESSPVTRAIREEERYAAQLDSLNIKLRPGTDHRNDSRPTPRAARHCKSIVYQTLEKLPREHRDAVKELTLFYTKDGRRGLGGNGSIILRCLNVTDSELSSVLLHEVAHLVDAHVLVGGDTTQPTGFFDFDTEVLADDPSVYFYTLSWDSESKRRDDSSTMDFVSSYATTDSFEDFSETYAYYRLHGADFRALAEDNFVLAQKYNFMKNFVFDGQEFDENVLSKVNTKKRNYDVTILPFSLKNFFNS